MSGIKIDRTAPDDHRRASDDRPERRRLVQRRRRGRLHLHGQRCPGVASLPDQRRVLTGDGADQSVTSDAGHRRGRQRSARQDGRRHQHRRHAPQTTADNQCTDHQRLLHRARPPTWSDRRPTRPGLSGVKEIRYTRQRRRRAGRRGRQPRRSASRSTAAAPAPSKYYAVDNAGNVEAANAGRAQVRQHRPDRDPHAVTPAPNAADWNNSDVTVHFDAKDDDAGSGVADVTSRPTSRSSARDGRQRLVVNGSAKDTAGNVGTDSVTVKLDKTAPTITGAIVGGTQGDNGWYVGPVTVHFTCSDALSGVATCPDDVTLTANGANQSVTGTATDKAGNTASRDRVGHQHRQRRTRRSPTVNVAGGIYTLGAVPAATCTATRQLLRPRLVQVTVTGGTANGVGTFTYTATATDKAGNTTHADRHVQGDVPVRRVPAADQRHRPPGRCVDQRLQGRQHRAGEVPAQERRRARSSRRPPRRCG